MPLHNYALQLIWQGNNGTGTSSYKNYERSYTVQIQGKPIIQGSSDPAFRGDATKINPEEMLLASVASCHMLWYLHLCAVMGIVVVDYTDNARATMQENEDGGGHFSQILLAPTVLIKDENQIEKAIALHADANKKCFVANSLNCPVLHTPTCKAI